VTYPTDPNNPSGGGYQGYPASPPGGGYQGYPASPPAGGYPGYPAAPRPKRLRGQRPLQIGAVLMAIGIVVMIIGVVVSSAGGDSKVNGFQRVKVSDHTGTITFKHSGGYLAYYESDSVTDSTSQQIPLIPTRLTSPANGQVLTLSTPYGDRSDGKVKYLHYDHDGHKGLAMFQFHIDQAGTYQVELGTNTKAAGDAQVAFGKSIAQAQVIGGLVLALGVLLLLAGLILLIIGFVKQRRNKRELRAGYGGVQPAGWPQTPPSWPSTGPSGQPTQHWPANDVQQGWPPPPDRT